MKFIEHNVNLTGNFENHKLLSPPKRQPLKTPWQTPPSSVEGITVLTVPASPVCQSHELCAKGGHIREGKTRLLKRVYTRLAYSP